MHFQVSARVAAVSLSAVPSKTLVPAKDFSAEYVTRNLQRPAHLYAPSYEIGADMRRESRHELMRMAAQVTMLSENQIQDARLEEVIGIHRDETAIARRVERDSRQHGDSHFQLDAGLAHVRVEWID